MKAVLFLTLALFAITSQSFPQKAPNSKINGRIIGGRDAWAGQYPFAASIQVRTQNAMFYCTGTVLTKEWILTAGQCVDGAVLFTITLGTNNLKDTNSVKVTTDNYVLHPDYNSFTYDNDIALIKLRMPITFTEYLKEIEFLPIFEVDLDGTPLQVFGWGQTSDDTVGPIDHLNWVTVSAISNDECKLFYGDSITDNMVCIAGEYNEGICIGDSGAPLIQHAGRGSWMHVGIASFLSSGGCEDVSPSGFTRTHSYVDWIKNITGRAY